jgi:phosphoribosylglycinamide formyltransferase 1
MKKIVALISGRGSNMQAIVRSGQAGAWRANNGESAAFSAVISNEPSAEGLVWARSQGIATRVVAHRDYAERGAFERALADVLAHERPDLIILAGFMRILGSELVSQFEGRMINIHPSLLPSFKGLHTHSRALAAGVKAHGATVHLVSPELDSGVVLAQAVLPVGESDTEDTLKQAVLAAEHVLYPKVVGWIARGEMVLSKDGYHWRDARATDAQCLWMDRPDFAALT